MLLHNLKGQKDRGFLDTVSGGCLFCYDMNANPTEQIHSQVASFDY